MATSYAGSATRAAASAAASTAPVAAPGVSAPVAAPDHAAEMRNVTRVAEIKRKLYHQGTAPAVLTTAGKGNGGHWGGARVIAFMRTPGGGPAAGAGVVGEG